MTDTEQQERITQVRAALASRAAAVQELGKRYPNKDGAASNAEAVAYARELDTVLAAHPVDYTGVPFLAEVDD